MTGSFAACVRVCSVTRLGALGMFLVTTFSFKNLPKRVLTFLGYFENVTFYAKIVMASFGQHFYIKLGYFFISTSGHTVSVPKNDEFAIFHFQSSYSSSSSSSFGEEKITRVLEKQKS